MAIVKMMVMMPLIPELDAQFFFYETGCYPILFFFKKFENRLQLNLRVCLHKITSVIDYIQTDQVTPIANKE